MGHFDDEKNVRAYIEMVKDYDGAEIVAEVVRHVPAGAAVLEIGMGPGKDLELLAKSFDVTGSDASKVFVDLYRADHPDADLMVLDAVTLETDRRFDALFSNKVLHHLTDDQLRRSFQRQRLLLEPSGVAIHTFWLGEGEEKHHGLLFNRHTEDNLRILTGDSFDLTSSKIYTEMAENDSLLVVLNRR